MSRNSVPKSGCIKSFPDFGRSQSGFFLRSLGSNNWSDLEAISIRKCWDPDIKIVQTLQILDGGTDGQKDGWKCGYSRFVVTLDSQILIDIDEFESHFGSKIDTLHGKCKKQGH